MRVVHIVPTITEEAAGPSYSVPRLCQSLIDIDVETQLITLDTSVNKSNLPFLKTFNIDSYLPKLGFSTNMNRWLKHGVVNNWFEVIHNHSIWMMPNVYPGFVVRNSSCHLVVSPRGTFSSYALGINKWQKKIFWWALQGRSLKAASCFHATAESEYEDIRRLGFKQPVCIIPNGIDVPPFEKKLNADRRSLLFLGRIHPKKGVEDLLHAWHAIEKKFPDWDLIIAGPDNGGYLDKMKSLASKLDLERVSFLGPLFGSEKLHAYRKAELFLLPTYSENFGMTVAESLAAGTPAIVTKGAPWEGLQTEGAGWWIDVGVQPLINCMEEALSLTPNSLTEKGRAGRDWMLRDFSWQHVGNEFNQVYEWLIHGGEVPSCVRVN